MHWTSGDTSAAVGVVTLVGTCLIWLLFRFMIPKFRAFEQFLRDFNGEPARPDDGVPERPGMMKRMSIVENGQVALATDVNWIKTQMKPNNGSSFYDKVNQAIASPTTPTTVVNVHTDGKETPQA